MSTLDSGSFGGYFIEANMDFLEKDLETIIYETPNDLLAKRGLSIRGEKRRQLRIGNYGVADIICFHRGYEELSLPTIEPALYINILELKKNFIDADAFWQALRYAKGLQNFLYNKRKFYHPLKFSITLIGKSIDAQKDFVYLPSLAQSSDLAIRFFTYKFKFDGIFFENKNSYDLIDEGF